MIRYRSDTRVLMLSGERDVFYWEPRQDILTHELAMCLTALLTEDAALVATLPPTAQRHFRREMSFTPERMNVPEPDARMGEPLEELAAAGRRLDSQWQIVGNIFLSAGEAEFGVCVRMRNAESE